MSPYAGTSIEHMKETGDVKGLIAALQEPYPDVRVAAARALGQLGDVQAVDPLVQLLGAKAWGDQVREAAAWALSQLDDVRAIQPLIAALREHGSHIRYEVASALAHIGAPALEPLLAALKEDQGGMAAVALGKMGEAALMPLLTALRDNDQQMRKNAAFALGYIGDTQAVEPLLGTLRDCFADVRLEAAKALQKLGWKPEGDELGAVYWVAKQDWDECIKMGVVAVEPLITALRNSAKEERKRAIYALGEIRDTRAVEPLCAVLKELTPDVDLREAAGRALDKLGWKPSADEIGAAYWITRKDWQQCVTIGAAAVEPLCAALTYTDYYGFRVDGLDFDKEIGYTVRSGAAWALGEIRDGRAVAPLNARLTDVEEEVCTAAEDALKKIREAPIARRSAALAHQEARITRPATVARKEPVHHMSEAEALAMITNASTVEPLIAALEDSENSDQVRKAAAEALGWLGDTQAEEALYAALSDSSSDVRDAAVQALEQIQQGS